MERGESFGFVEILNHFNLIVFSNQCFKSWKFVDSFYFADLIKRNDQPFEFYQFIQIL